MKDNRNIEERLLAGKKDYQNIPVPGEMKTRMEAGIARAENELVEREKYIGKESIAKDGNHSEGEKSGRTVQNQKEQKLEMKRQNLTRFRIAATVAAAALILVILPNTSADVAHAMGSLPVVGRLFQAVTFRNYEYESERFDAHVEVPQIVVGNVAENGTESDAGNTEDAGNRTDAENGATGHGEGAGQDASEADAENKNKGETPDTLQQTVEQINFDIEKVTNQLIEEFQESADLGESYGGLEIHHETVTNNERYFTLKLSIFQVAGSGAESYKFYTIDKQTGKQIQIGDLFREGSNYREVLSENLKDQMRAKMAEDENNIYWVDYSDVPEWNWERIKEDQNFYFDEAGNIVISFDEYEVAPGYMGAQEFTVEQSVFEKLLKEKE